LIISYARWQHTVKSQNKHKSQKKTEMLYIQRINATDSRAIMWLAVAVQANGLTY